MLAGCAKAGAVVANTSAQNADLLYQYGINLGIAFQLKDDLLDIYADYEIFGKSKGVDIQGNKKTYLYLRTLQDASAEDRDTLLHLFSDPSIPVDEKCDQTIQIYNQYHAKEKTEIALKSFVAKALQNLDDLKDVNQDIKEEFVVLTNKLTDRDK
jgi:geranylgeranyl diphosphate synthase type II